MDNIFKKLHYKDHKEIVVWNAPASFEENIKSIADKSVVKRDVAENDKIEFFIGFVTQQSQVNEVTNRFASKLVGDAVFWLCYPKKTSQRYICEFNRDKGWDVLGKYDLEGVRQVAIDEDWVALRFRKIQYLVGAYCRETKTKRKRASKKV
ncbi:MAG: hypothetical protein NZM38_10285 [Cytophagales bacterium]|nr:hypothetical protein [Cytophagales bacterium]MDW8385141.1 hypothetical protein [Flammeovirgaceae bacterium]